MSKFRKLCNGGSVLRQIKKPRLNSSSVSSFASDNEPKKKILYKYENLTRGYLVKRYKRFLADVQLDDESIVTVYCPNTGPMVGLLDEKMPEIRLSYSDGGKRKYPYTLEMIKIPNSDKSGFVWVGIHSALANKMVEKALQEKWFPEVGEYTEIKREVPYAKKSSRIDFLLDGRVYVEVKSVTLVDELKCAVFPDTVSKRAQKHISELTEIVNGKKDAMVVFLIQRCDSISFSPSRKHDATFSSLCEEAATQGVKLLSYSCEIVVENDSASVLLVEQLETIGAENSSSDVTLLHPEQPI